MEKFTPAQEKVFRSFVRAYQAGQRKKMVRRFAAGLSARRPGNVIDAEAGVCKVVQFDLWRHAPARIAVTQRVAAGKAKG